MTKYGIPMDTLKIQACTCKTNCETNCCGCKKKNMSCSINCNCTINHVVCCMNAPESVDDEDEDWLVNYILFILYLLTLKICLL